MFFDQWSDVLRVLVVGTSAYAALVLILRVSGKRTLAKLNAFDLVVSVALGSTLATVLLSGDVSLVSGVVAMGLLVLLQLVVGVGVVPVAPGAAGRQVLAEPAPAPRAPPRGPAARPPRHRRRGPPGRPGPGLRRAGPARGGGAGDRRLAERGVAAVGRLGGRARGRRPALT